LRRKQAGANGVLFRDDKVKGTAVPASALVTMLQGQADRPIIDKTERPVRL
jgi:hypothetical protein